MNRRQFTRAAVLSSAAAMAAPQRILAGSHMQKGSEPLSVHIFSKHLQFLDYKEMAVAARAIGFDGIDLTVRPKGHVEPENAASDLPRAVAAIKEAGQEVVMMTSGVNNADDPVNRQVLETASEQGIQYYRTAYYKFPKEIKGSYRENMNAFKQTWDKLGALNQKLGLHGAYQNHSGTNLGSYVTDIAYLLEGCDPRWLGCQYDIRHATVEGATAWPLGLHWLKDHIRIIAIKDFVWGEKNGRLAPVNVPLGKGVVDFKGFFKLLREYGIQPVVSLHCEYDLGGAEKGSRELEWPRQKVYDTMREDLEFLRAAWAE